MIHLVVIAVAGAVGALARYGMVNWIGGKSFPWGTLTVNVIGSALMGLFYVAIVEREVLSPEMKPLFMTGFLGAFTTFSAFSLEAWELLDRGEALYSFLYVFGSMALGIAALSVAVFAARATL